MDHQSVLNLLHSMSLKEKLGEMTQLPPMLFGNSDPEAITGPLDSLALKRDDLKYAGSTLNLFNADRLKALQKKHMEEHPHHIPMLFMADVIHGCDTIFPIPLAIGCSFDPAVNEAASAAAAKEASAYGIHVTFAPMADLVRDPRWGRVMESTGEDPYLNGEMAAAAVRGFQGDDPKQKGRLASCVKHFAAYGGAEGGREYNTVDISKGTLYDFYLSGYKGAVDAGAKMVMTSFNILDRIPAGANRELYQEILRNQMKFRGTVISDYAAVKETMAHGYASDAEEAVCAYLPNCDIEMCTANYFNCAEKLIREGRLSMEEVDAAVLRILNLKNDLGLFENPYKDAGAQPADPAVHREQSRDAARKTMVLLKNEQVLPLPKDGKMKIGIAGPFAESTELLGGWVIRKSAAVSVTEGMKRKFCNAEIVTAMTQPLGSMLDGVFDVEDHAQEAAEKLKSCDVIIAAVGENQNDTGEGASKTNLRLSANQEKLIAKLKETGKPLVLLVFSGRPLELAPVLERCDAVLQCWFPGTEGGNAVADILSGDYNPSAKLSISFTVTAGQIPVYYNHYSTGRCGDGRTERFLSRYLDCPNEPLYPFGYGLSYSDFVYSNLKVQAGEKTIKVSVTVKNSSDVKGTETVQLYVHDLSACVVRPVSQLKAFRKAELEAGQTAEITFELTQEKLSFYDNGGRFVFEHGKFEIMVGPNSAHLLKETIEF